MVMTTVLVGEFCLREHSIPEECSLVQLLALRGHVISPNARHSVDLSLFLVAHSVDINIFLSFIMSRLSQPRSNHPSLTEPPLSRDENIAITEEMVKAAAGNRVSGKEVMELLIESRREHCHQEEVVKAPAGNSMSGVEVMELLLSRDENSPSRKRQS
jgi:hypothetical protein